MVFSFRGAVTQPQPMHNPWGDSMAIARAVFDSWSDRLDVTHVGTAIAVFTAAPAAWRFLQDTWEKAYAYIRQIFLSEIIIPPSDPINRSVVRWMLANRPRHHRAFTGRSGRGGLSAASSPAYLDRGEGLKKNRHPVQYFPHWDSRWLWFQGTLFVVARASNHFTSSLLADPNYEGIGGEELTVSCFGWSAEPIRRLIDTCREFSDGQTQFFVVIYGRDRYSMGWKPKARRPLRLLETVHFDESIKQELLADMRNYLDPRTQRLYQGRSMPYRRGYLFYGPPGTGKSSLSVALAGEFGLDLYEVKMPSVANDGDLEQMFQEIPPQCIVLLEDIDAVWVDRSAGGRSNSPSMGAHVLEPGYANDGASIRSGMHSSYGGAGGGGPVSNCTLSGLLNVLDGVGSQEGRIVIMTTNHPERLDSALTRPGRVDMKIELGNISVQSAEDMFVRMFSPDNVDTLSGPSPPSSQTAAGRQVSITSAPTPTEKVSASELRELAAQFASHIPDGTFTPSRLQGFFQLHLESPHDAADSIGAWVQKELPKKSDKEYEMIPTVNIEKSM